MRAAIRSTTFPYFSTVYHRFQGFSDRTLTGDPRRARHWPSPVPAAAQVPCRKAKAMSSLERLPTLVNRIADQPLKALGGLTRNAQFCRLEQRLIDASISSSNADTASVIVIDVGQTEKELRPLCPPLSTRCFGTRWQCEAT